MKSYLIRVKEKIMIKLAPLRTILTLASKIRISSIASGKDFREDPGDEAIIIRLIPKTYRIFLIRFWVEAVGKEIEEDIIAKIILKILQLK